MVAALAAAPFHARVLRPLPSNDAF